MLKPNPKALHALLSLRCGTLLGEDLKSLPPLTDEECERLYQERIYNNRNRLPQNDIAFTWREKLIDSLSIEDENWIVDYLVNETPKAQLKNIEKIYVYRHSDKDLELKPLWVAPNGDFWHCEYSKHNKLADALVPVIYPEDWNTSKNGEWILEKNGWVKITFEDKGQVEIRFGNQYQIKSFPPKLKQILLDFLNLYEKTYGYLNTREFRKILNET